MKTEYTDDIRLMEGASSHLKSCVSNILNCFNGADGGVSFVLLIQLLVSLDKEAKEGKESAKTLLQSIEMVSGLIDYATKMGGKR